MAAHKSNDGSPRVGKRDRDHDGRSRSHSSWSPTINRVSRTPSPRSKRLKREREISKSENAKESRNRDNYHNKDKDWDKGRDREKEKSMNATRDKDVDQSRGRDRSQGERRTDPGRNGSRREQYKDQSPIRRPTRNRGDIETDATRDGSTREKNRDFSPMRSYDRRGGKNTDASKSGTGENYWDHSPKTTRDWSRGDKDANPSRDKADREKYRDQSPTRSRHHKFSSPKVTHQRLSHSSPRSNEKHTSGHFGNSRNDSLTANDEDHPSAGSDRHRVDDFSRDDSISQMKATEAALEAKAKEKAKPSFEYSGKLAAETNKVRGVALLFTEPPEARKPTIRWRLYVFKEAEPLKEPLYIHRQSCYLFGRERRVADVPTDHPSCSKQHAVIQYRLIEKMEADGTESSKIKPYLMDLGSTNGTFLNGERIEPQRYYELFEKDTVKFGNSSREYVLLHERSAG